MKEVLIFAIILILFLSQTSASSLLEKAKFCKFVKANPRCDPNTRYRSINGFCNNLKYPKWGAENSFSTRFIEARYQDGISEFIKSSDGNELPNPREISIKLYSNRNTSSDLFSLVLPQYGQYIAVDMGSTADTLLELPCCNDNGTLAQVPRIPMCKYIPIDSTDPTYELYPRECMNFIRTSTDISENCTGYVKDTAPAEQINIVTSFLDHSGIYGSNNDDMKNLRSYKDGLLRTRTVAGSEYPTHMTKETSICPEDNAVGRCYLFGDFRPNSLPGLAAIATLFIREHNRLARELKRINPLWNDEKLFQEARKINIAELQHITYYQMFRELLGISSPRTVSNSFGNNEKTHYDSDVNPGMSNEHANCAYRFFHTMVQDSYELYSTFGHPTKNLPLKDIYFRPSYLEISDNMDQLTRGMCRQPASAPDSQVVDGVREFLFRGTEMFALDLKALDIQRARDHGMGSYNDAREYCGMERAVTWSGFSDEIMQSDIDSLKDIYKQPDDVELIVAGSLERIIPDAAVGKTFHCLMMQQLYNSRAGDRFWFENSDSKIGFSRNQLEQIRKTSLARIICDNGRNIERIQKNVFRLPSDMNPIVDCNRIPKPSLMPWTMQILMQSIQTM